LRFFNTWHVRLEPGLAAAFCLGMHGTTAEAFRAASPSMRSGIGASPRRQISTAEWNANCGPYWVP